MYFFFPKYFLSDFSYKTATTQTYGHEQELVVIRHIPYTLLGKLISIKIRYFNTLRLRQNGRHFMQTALSRASSCMKIVVFRLTFYWNLFPMVLFTISQHWFILWLRASQATSHYLNQCWPSLLPHICVTRHLASMTNHLRYKSLVTKSTLSVL